MKNKNVIMLIIVGMLLAANISNAQDYKHPQGLVDSKGKVTDANGTYLGSVSSDGKIKDATGATIAHVSADGNLVDTQTGKIIGHVPKNGNFIYYFPENKKDSLMTAQPLNGTCEVTDSKGKKVVSVHENYKHVGACAYHCLYEQKQGKKTKTK